MPEIVEDQIENGLPVDISQLNVMEEEFHEYVNVDEKVMVCAELSVEEIAMSHLARSLMGDPNNASLSELELELESNEPIVCFTNSEAMKRVDYLYGINH